MGKRMLVLCPYPLGVAAGQRLKFEQYYDDWGAAGWQVEADPFMDLALWSVAFEPGHVAAKSLGVVKGYARRLRSLLRIRSYDLVYVFMYVTPLGTSFSERLVRKLARRLVLDVEGQCGQPARQCRRQPSQSAAEVPARDLQDPLPDPRGRPCCHQLAVAQRAVPSYQPQAGLHLRFVVDRFREVRASQPLRK
jgi:hypothetical protein